VHEFYYNRGLLKANNVKLVVDLGANVGYSILYFLHVYPLCRVIAFEPHPAHAAQINHNLELDRSHDRVELYPKAAGGKNCLMRLTDARSASSLTDRMTADTLSVEMKDVFPIFGDKRIDLLKMDMEGGEYEILADDRFPMLDIGAIVMEWHSRGQGIEDKRWCVERLQGLGFVIEEIFTTASHGMFWATRRR
jgi:FkbM family methyltransferase